MLVSSAWITASFESCNVRGMTDKAVETLDEARALRDEFKAGRKEVPVSKSTGEVWNLYKAKRDRAKEAKERLLEIAT